MDTGKHRVEARSNAIVLSVFQLMTLFPNEKAAERHIKSILWKDGVHCPFCESQKHYILKNGVYYCGSCKKTYTIRTNTIFHRSHIPLDKWLYAMYKVVTARKGISSMQLSKELGITQKSAWYLLQRIRVACGNQIKMLLEGIVEVDEAYFGGKERNKHASKRLHVGGGTGGKIPVVGMRSRKGDVIAQAVNRPNMEKLMAMIRNNVSKDATICTDESRLYNRVSEHFEHKKVNHSAKQYVDGMAHTNSIESVWAILRRGFYGTFHSFSWKHVNLYVDEFVFRLNEGNCKYDTTNRLKSLLQGTQGKRVTYKLLTQGV